MLSCVEVGGSGVQTVLLPRSGDDFDILAGAHHAQGSTLLVASPGLVADGRVVAALHLGWVDVDPALQLGLPGSASLLLNDAEAAVLGESALRGGVDVVRVGLGTGVGAAVVRGSVTTANLLAHRTELTFGAETCRCRAVGCLETVAGGWALPAQISPAELTRLVVSVARALDAEPLTSDVATVVLTGGLVGTHPELIGRLADLLPGRSVEPSAAPAGVKSAAAWGLRASWQLPTQR